MHFSNMYRSSFNALLLSILSGFAITLTIDLFCLVADALPSNQISQLAKKFTVLIDSESPGTGVIVSKKGSTYTVLTAAHVVEYEDYEYVLLTPDQKEHPIQYKVIKKLPGIDLAILEFNSTQTYSTAELTNSDEAVEGSPVYIAGFPDPGTATETRIFQFTSGEVSARPTSGPKGYLMHYTNITRVGMSGGPVLDSEGRLVGIHGLANTDPESGTKTGINLGIPINSFVDLSSKVGFKFLDSAPKAVTKQPNPATSIAPVQVPSLVPTAPSQNPSILPRRPKPIRPNAPSLAPVCAGIRC